MRGKTCENLNVHFKAKTGPQNIANLWKRAVVTPIHNKGEKRNLNIYQKISLLNSDDKKVET